MRQLYPEIEPYNSFFLDGESAHRVYVEESGNPSGIPVLFLHGGPGSGAKPHHRQYFDPARYRIVIFDQRGSGRSTPHGLLENNATGDLLADIDAIRQRLNIDRWLLFGGSWGATLALLYAERFPQHVSGMILRGSYLARAYDYQWVLGGGVERIFPEHWREFLLSLAAAGGTAGLPASDLDGLQSAMVQERAQCIVDTLHACVNHDSDAVRLAAAKAWALWTGRIVTYTIMNEYILDAIDEQKLINEVGIEVHYARHRYFIKENEILDNIARIPPVPVMIVHGRLDMTCTVSAAWELHHALPESKLVILPRAGHLAGEEPMVDALVTATDDMAEKLVTSHKS